MKSCLLVTTGAFHLGGGIAVVSRMTIRLLAEAGYALDIYSLLETDDAIDRSYTGAAPVTYRVFRGSKAAFSAAVWRALLRRSYDLVLCDHVNLASILAPYGLFSKKGYAVWLYGTDVFAPRPDFEGRLGLRLARRRLAISEFTRRKVLERFPGLPVAVCGLALDPVRFSDRLPPISELPPADLTLTAVNGQSCRLGRQVILFVGRMDSLGRYKGQAKLLQAFPGLFARFPEAQLVLAGSGDDDAYYLEMARALPAGAPAAVFLPGQAPDDLLKKLYQACCLFAMPSLGEGFGLVYLEAMRYAKPCLGCREDAAAEVIQDGVTGILVDAPATPAQVAEACGRLLADPPGAARMGQAGYALLHERFLFPHFQQRFWAAMKS